MKHSLQSAAQKVEKVVLLLTSIGALTFVVLAVAAIVEAASAPAYYQISPLPTPTFTLVAPTPTDTPVPPTPTDTPAPPTPTDTPVPPTPTDTPVPPTPTDTPVPPTPTDTPVPNRPPVIDAVSGPTAPVDIDDQPVTVVVDFSDPDNGDTHVVNWEWGDGSQDSQTNATSPASQSHTYAVPGVYTVEVTVTDAAGAFDSATYEFIVIFDPTGGYVTGGGSINSPAGAYKPDHSLTGKATFGFVSRYTRGANVPTGNTNFQFKAGDLNFHSDTYEWLVVNRNDSNAQFKGQGTVNGMLDHNGHAYHFMLWAGDGSPDTFRIKIWYEVSAAEILLYDNGSQYPVSGGSVVIHGTR